MVPLTRNWGLRVRGVDPVAGMTVRSGPWGLHALWPDIWGGGPVAGSQCDVPNSGMTRTVSVVAEEEGSTLTFCNYHTCQFTGCTIRRDGAVFHQ